MSFNESKEINSSIGGSVTFTYLQPFTHTYIDHYYYMENIFSDDPIAIPIYDTYYSVEELIINVTATNDAGSVTERAKLWSGVGYNGGDWTSVGIEEQNPTNHLLESSDMIDAITGTWKNETLSIERWTLVY